MAVPHGFVERLAELSKSGTPFVCVTMVEAVGSTPQDTGSKMLVTTEGLVTGTVGGGRVEAKAIDVAKGMLGGRNDEFRMTNDEQGHSSFVIRHSSLLLEWNLKRDVGMTCGGTVKLFFETYNHAVWRIVIFGAGHVASAVAQCLGQLDCHVTCIDPRSEWLDKIPDGPRLQKRHVEEPRALVAEVPDDAFVVCMTMGHATDRPILDEIFRQGRAFPFLGVIGSRAKRAVLVKELTEAGIPRERSEAFHCPIGLDLGTNQPGEVAVSVVAQLIQERDRWREQGAGSKEREENDEVQMTNDEKYDSSFVIRHSSLRRPSLLGAPRSLLTTRRFDVVEQTVTRPDGREASCQYVRHGGSVAILPLVDDAHVCLIKSRRLTVDETLIEVPAGTREPDEPPLETARRELAEETGYRAARFDELALFYPSPGITNETMHVYVARDLTPGEPAREENEEIENLVVTFAEALAMIDRGEIRDGKTIVALLAWARQRGD